MITNFLVSFVSNLGGDVLFNNLNIMFYDHARREKVLL